MGVERDYVIVKICLMGDSAVGKTSLIKRYVYDVFEDKYLATIGSKVTKKEMDIEVEGRRIRTVMMLWDILGQKKYFYSNVYFKGASGAIFVADLTKRETMDNFRFWYRSFVRVRGKEKPILVLLNKADLVHEQAFDIEYARGVLEDHGEFETIYTSAKTGEGVKEAFKAIADMIVRRIVP